MQTDVHILVRRFQDGETDILAVSTNGTEIDTERDDETETQAQLTSPASVEVQSWPVDLPGARDVITAGWTAEDLHTLIVTAGEIAATYGTGTDGLDRDDVLSTRQRAILRQAVQFYLAYTGEDDDEPAAGN
jgi:hypothetical protein